MNPNLKTIISEISRNTSKGRRISESRVGELHTEIELSIEEIRNKYSGLSVDVLHSIFNHVFDKMKKEEHYE